MASVIANVNRDHKKQSQPFTPFDFMPHWQAEPPKLLSAEESVDMIAMLNQMLGGVDLRERVT